MRHALLALLIPALLAGGIARADDEFDAKYIQTSTSGEVLTQLGMSAYPAAYGEMLEAYKIAAENPLAEKMVKQFADDVGMFAQSIGRGINLFDAGNKLASGDVAEAGLSLLLTGLSEAAGTDAAKAGERALLGMLFKDAATAAVQPTFVINAAITAFQIWRESVKQVEETKAAVQVEALYYRIQSDKSLFRGAGSGRTLGTGDPIPADKAAIERVFRRVLIEPDFREQFKAYAEAQGGSFPEPSWWDQKTTSDAETTAQSAVLQDRGQVDTWIAALLAQLNREAKAREAQQVVANQLRQLQKLFGNGPRLAAEVARMWDAIKKLPEIEKYAEGLPKTIAEAKAKKQFDLLNIILGKIEYTVGKDLKYVPAGGSAGARRAKVLASLIASWQSAKAAAKSIPAEAEKEFASTASANPIPAVKDGPVLTLTPLTISTIDIALAELRQAKSVADLDARTGAMLADLEKKYRAFSDQFYQANPDHGNDLSHLQQNFYRHNDKGTLTFDTQAYTNDPLVRAFRGYQAQRDAYPKAKSVEYQALVAAITDLQRSVRANVSEASGRRVEALTALSGVAHVYGRADYRKLVTFDAAPAVEGIAAKVAAMKKPDGYVGYTKLSFPKWEVDGYAVRSYVGSLAYKSKPLLEAWQALERDCAESKTYLPKARQTLALELAEVNKNLQLATTLVADYGLRQDATIASKLAAAETEVGAVRQRAASAEQAGKKADEDCTRLQASAAENIANIQNDSGYLAALLKKIEYWSDIIVNEKYGGAQVVYVGVVTEGSSGTKRKFLAPSKSDLSLYDKTKANAVAEALLQDIGRTGIARWDPQDDTGLKKLLEAKAAELRTYAVDAPDWEIVDCCVVYGSRITKLANDVRAIPTSSYGTMTYAQGIKNRSFDSDLGAALRNGTAFALDLSVRTDSNTQRIEVPMASLQKVASSAKNGAVKTAAADVAKAVNDHLNRYNPQMDQEQKKFKEDAAKLEKNLAAWNECANKNPGREPQVCGNPPSAGGTSTTTAAAPTQPPPTTVPTGVPGGTPGPAGPPGGQAKAPGGAPSTMAQGGSPAGGQPGSPQGTGGQGGPAGGTQAKAPGGQSAAPAGAPQGMAPSGGQPGAGQSGPPQGMAAGGQREPQSPGTGQSGPAAGQPPSGQGASAPPGGGQAPAPGGQQAKSGGPSAPPQAAGGQRGAQPALSQGGPAGAGAQPGAARGRPPGTPTGRPGGAPGAGRSMAMAPSGVAAAPQTPDQTPAVRDMYQKFAEAYQRKDARGVTKYLTSNWQSSSGSSVMDLEDTLANSFRVFDTIQFQIQGLQIQKASDKEYRVTYSAILTGRINKRNLKHEDKANVTDTVSITPDGPRIAKTAGATMWNKK